MELITQSNKEAIVGDLVNNFLSEVKRKYGTGNGDGINPKAYHNSVHTQDVIDSSLQIAQLAAERNKIKMSEVPVVVLAAASHDIEQDLGSIRNEEESAQHLEKGMREAKIFSEEEIANGKKMVMATVVFFEDEVMKQSATDDYLPRVLADADLADLGKEWDFYWDRSIRLLKEIGKTDPPSKEAEIAFTKKEIILLENHRFYTDEARELFPRQQENLELAKEHLKQIEAFI